MGVRGGCLQKVGDSCSRRGRDGRSHSFPPSNSSDLGGGQGGSAIKSNSSRWASEEGHKFAWQQGYGAFSVSSSLVPTVVRYIQNQEAHHRKMSFDAEFIALLRKHGMEFDPKHVFG